VISLAHVLETLGAELAPSLERLNVAASIVDASGRIRWQNAASVALVGERNGSHFTSVLAPENVRDGHTAFTRQIIGTEESIDKDLVLVDKSGRRTAVVAIGVPLQNGDRVVGVFGIARPVSVTQPPVARPHLTPRQHETLRLLASGCSTEAIAAELGIAVNTTRGHIRRLLSALDAHSRLEAVVRGRELGLI
jgi:DNA-binding CsgD family transcriptional regulator